MSDHEWIQDAELAKMFASRLRRLDAFARLEQEQTELDAKIAKAKHLVLDANEEIRVRMMNRNLDAVVVGNQFARLEKRLTNTTVETTVRFGDARIIKTIEDQDS